MSGEGKGNGKSWRDGKAVKIMSLHLLAPIYDELKASSIQRGISITQLANELLSVALGVTDPDPIDSTNAVDETIDSILDPKSKE